MHGNPAADQHLCFHLIDKTIPLLPKSEIQASSHLLWLYSLVWSDLVGTSEDRFSLDMVHF